MAKKGTWIKIITGVGLAVGAGAAIATVIKKKSEKIGEELDFNNSVYFDEEDDMLKDYDEQEFEEEIDTEDDMVKLEYSDDDSIDTDIDVTVELSDETEVEVEADDKVSDEI